MSYLGEISVGMAVVTQEFICPWFLVLQSLVRHVFMVMVIGDSEIGYEVGFLFTVHGL